MSKLDNTDYINSLCRGLREYSALDPELFHKYHVNRGLRRPDGTGVVAGITKICNVHGYMLNEGEIEAIPGELIYRGYEITDLVHAAEQENRFGYEETAYLLLFGKLPTAEQLADFRRYIAESRELPDGFVLDMIAKAPSNNIMNKLARSVLALYSYDEECEVRTLENEVRIAVSMIARLPVIMSAAYQVKRQHFDGESLVMHPLRPEESNAETILSLLRLDRKYTSEEAHLLDVCMMLHAEHGGGNNSAFTCRVLTSSGTDPYSAYSGAIGALKGFRHGGANIKVIEQLEMFKREISDPENEGQVADLIRRVLRKEAGDGAGLIYGMGHAVYTLSDPRAVLLKEKAFELAKGREIEADFRLLETIERLTPELISEKSAHAAAKYFCANVDLYSGLVYRMLGIPADLLTPMFAVSRIAGWAAHRIEEVLTGGRIIRPAYKSLAKRVSYIPMAERK
ncbi:MAG: citrate synthase [Oscillospiraceae bacterium]|nr:citrate synthase [Oscillospiraceae bacterium]